MTTTGKTVTVKISFSVEVDAEAWADEYGTDGLAAIRADVKLAAESGIKQQFSSVGVLAE